MLRQTCRNFSVGIQSVSAAVQCQTGFLLHIPGQRPDDLRRNVRRVGYHNIKLCSLRDPGPEIRLPEPDPLTYAQQAGIFLRHSQSLRGNIHGKPPAFRQ